MALIYKEGNEAYGAYGLPEGVKEGDLKPTYEKRVCLL